MKFSPIAALCAASAANAAVLRLGHLAASVPSTDASLSKLGSAVAPVLKTVESAFEQGIARLSKVTAGLVPFDADLSDHSSDSLPHDEHHHKHHGGHGDHDRCNKTIYQLIKHSEHTTKFVELLDQFPDLVATLNDTEAHFTLFAPTNEAFEHLPDDETPAKDVVEAILKYHIVDGVYCAKRVLKTNTFPTLFHEDFIGGEAQRLRVRLSLRGLLVNFYSRIVAIDIPASNGIIHGVNRLVVPPPMIGKVFTMLPAKFSTLLYAYQKTDFVKYIHNIPQIGSTVLAPSNKAFERMGVAANAFLFNSDRGLKYLEALLKYQVVTNVTVYSEAVYNSTDSGDDSGEDDSLEGSHHGKCLFCKKKYVLPTLLQGRNVTLTVKKLAGFPFITANKHVPAAISDIVAKNGVLHVFDHIVLPKECHGVHPCPHHGHGQDAAAHEFSADATDISVEELVARLGPLDEDESPVADSTEQRPIEMADL